MSIIVLFGGAISSRLFPVCTMGSATIDDINELERMKQELAEKKEDWGKRCESYNKQTKVTIPAREAKFKEDAWNQILKANEDEFQKAFEGLRGSKEKFLSELKDRIAGKPGHTGTVCDRPNLISRAKTLYNLATTFRQAIEKANAAGEFDNDMTFYHFPRGCCGDTCYLLAEYLSWNGFSKIGKIVSEDKTVSIEKYSSPELIIKNS